MKEKFYKFPTRSEARKNRIKWYENLPVRTKQWLNKDAIYSKSYLYHGSDYGGMTCRSEKPIKKGQQSARFLVYDENYELVANYNMLVSEVIKKQINNYPKSLINIL